MVFSPLVSLKLWWLEICHKVISYVNATQMFAACVLILFPRPAGHCTVCVCVCVCMLVHMFTHMCLWKGLSNINFG